jgi:hypothetical protein
MGAGGWKDGAPIMAEVSAMLVKQSFPHMEHTVVSLW